MKRLDVAVLAALILAFSMASGATAAPSRPSAARATDWLCSKRPDFSEICVRLDEVTASRLANGYRSVVAPFQIRSSTGIPVVEGHFFVATCSGKEVVATALRDSRGADYAADSEPSKTVEPSDQLADRLCEWKART